MNSLKQKLLICALLTGFAYWLGSELRVTGPLSSNIDMPWAPRSADSSTAKTNRSLEAKETREAIEPQTGFAKVTPEQIDFKSLTTRFSSPYPQSPSETEAAHHDLRQKNEIVDRLRILRELKISQEKTTAPAALANFTKLYSVILSNASESWLVQRQALKNMNPLWATLSPAERNKLSASIDIRAKAHWRESDRDLAAMVWRENAR